MAEIFRAHTSSKKIVAIKKILPVHSSNEKFIHMFLDEARIVAPLDHPNIVQTLDFGKIDQTYFLAMEWIDGKALSTVVRQQIESNMQFPIPVALVVALDVCEGLGYAHSRSDAFGRPLGIVHRDISPPNILITRNAIAKIADFGIAAAEGRTTQTRPGVIRGKFSYMSPEQSKGGALDGRSDLFSIGIILYELLTSQRLFFKESEADTILAVREGKIPSIDSFRSDVSGSLRRLIRKALAVLPKKRFAAAEEMAEAIRDILRYEYPTTSRLNVTQFLSSLFPDEPFEGNDFPLVQSRRPNWRTRLARLFDSR